MAEGRVGTQSWEDRLLGRVRGVRGGAGLTGNGVPCLIANPWDLRAASLRPWLLKWRQ